MLILPKFKNDAITQISLVDDSSPWKFHADCRLKSPHGERQIKLLKKSTFVLAEATKGSSFGFIIFLTFGTMETVSNKGLPANFTSSNERK